MRVDLSKIEPRLLSKESPIEDFDCGDKDLNEFLLDDAFSYQENYLAKTTLIYYDKKLIGYYTLSCDSIRLEMDEIAATFRIGTPMSSFPAIKLARMAFTKDCQNQGCGTFIINIVRGFAHKLNKEGAGCRFITVDAYPNRVNFYLQRGFKHNVHRAYKKKNHPSLRLDVWNPSIEPSK